MDTLVLVNRGQKNLNVAGTVECEDANSDRALVARVKAGDREAFKDLFDRYHRRLLSVAVGVVKNPQDAEDVVQDAFVKAYRNINSFLGNSSFYTWLYRIVFNLCIDLSRKSYRKNESGVDDSNSLDVVSRSSGQDPLTYLGSVKNPEESLRNSEIKQRLSKALSELSEEHRAVILLREVDGFSYAEIGDVLKCSKGTVMSRLHHARKRLQLALKDFV